MTKAELIAAVAEKSGFSKKDSEKAVAAVVDAITEAALNSEDETAFGENIMEAVNAIQAREADPLELTYQKEGNTWNITSEGQQALYSVLFAN